MYLFLYTKLCYTKSISPQALVSAPRQAEPALPALPREVAEAVVGD